MNYHKSVFSKHNEYDFFIHVDMNNSKLYESIVAFKINVVENDKSISVMTLQVLFAQITPLCCLKNFCSNPKSFMTYRL